ncbi:putative transmembrane protein 138-like [Scophthalmus maximus]|uniref:Transmembrane protein 138 n=2 Tax=Scophthalmus maximus TaxID=52904 RepID=A0A2U9BBM8_SCOMX|nr:putative transmembrane protein 138-like [Scophthalmus maximus]
MSTSVICRQLIPNPDALSHVERTSVSPPVNGRPDAASRTPHQHLGKIGVESFEGLSRDNEIHAALDPAWNHSPSGRPAFGPETLQTSNYSLVLLIQLSLLSFDLFVNSFGELLRTEPAVQLVLFVIQDIATLFNLIIILLMLFNTYVFQVGLVAVLLERFRSLLMLSALYLTFSIILHSWLMNLRWLNTNRFIWTDGLQVLFVFQRAASVLYYYFYKRTAEYLGDPRLYEDSPWLREVFARIRQ